MFTYVIFNKTLISKYKKEKENTYEEKNIQGKLSLP
jgi:hypothetical protein